MAMSKQYIRDLVREQTGKDEVLAGYNYTMMSLQTQNPDSLVAALRKNKAMIEHLAGVRLLDYVCLKRAYSVIVPVPSDARYNKVSSALLELIPHVPFTAPFWG